MTLPLYNRVCGWNSKYMCRLIVQNTSEKGHSQDEDSCDTYLDVNDNSFQVNVINSNEFDPKKFASYEIPLQNVLPTFDLNIEQGKDDEISEIKAMVLHGNPTKDNLKKYIVVDDTLYYITDPDNEPVLRLYVPKHLRALIIKQYHDHNGHMGVQKTYDAIRQKYFWPNLFKELHQHVSSRSLQKVRKPLQETDQPPYAMAKLSLDLSGPYPTTLSNNKYIIAFVDWYSGWPEAFPVPDKTADTVAHLLMEEIFPRYGCPYKLSQIMGPKMSIGP